MKGWISWASIQDLSIATIVTSGNVTVGGDLEIQGDFEEQVDGVVLGDFTMGTTTAIGGTFLIYDDGSATEGMKYVPATGLSLASLTATRVVFAGASGLLSDDSDLTFSGDTLTVTKIAATSFTGAVNFTSQSVTNVGAAGNDFGATNTLVATTFSGTVDANDNAVTNVTTLGGTDGTADLVILARGTGGNRKDLVLKTRGTSDADIARMTIAAGDGQQAVTWLSTNHVFTPTATGTLMDFQLETEWTTGTLINADFGGATTLTGGIIGVDLDFSTNVTPTDNDDITGYKLNTPAFTQTDTSTMYYRGFFIESSGALEQNTAAGNIRWHGIDMAFPNVTETTGDIEVVGLSMDMGTSADGGDSYGIRITGAADANFDTHAGIYINMAAAGDAAISVATGDINLVGAGQIKFAADGAEYIYSDGGAIIFNVASNPIVYIGATAIYPATVNDKSIGLATSEWSDLYLGDASIIYFGNDQDVTLTHQPDVGLLLNLALTFNDGGIIQTGPDDADNLILKADDIGVGQVEVARLQGAADPYFQLTLPALFTPIATASLPATPVEGMFTYDATLDQLTYRDSDSWETLVAEGATFTKHVTIIASNLGNPSANPPTKVIQDNVEVSGFTLNTDQVFINFDLTEEQYVSGDLVLEIEWTNDGGADDQTKEVRWQIDFQTYTGEGDNIDGSHGNSPYNSGDDTYDSAAGWIAHIATVTIPAADFSGAHSILMKLSAVTIGDGVALTSEPHLINIHMQYTAYRVQQ